VCNKTVNAIKNSFANPKDKSPSGETG